MYYDKEAKTVKIPIRIINGQIKYFYGGNLPSIKDGTIGELILPEYSITDYRILNALQSEDKVKILPSGTIIMVSVNRNKVPEDKAGATKDINVEKLEAINCTFVEVRLLEDLFLLLRGSKKASLLPVKCIIPSINNMEVESLNSAYTAISREFEPHRSSHTGNVFEKCYYYEGEKGIWYPLEVLRNGEESKLEERLFLDSRNFRLTKTYDRNDTLENEDEKMLLEELEIKNQVSGSRIKEIFKNDKFRYIKTINSLIKKGIIEDIE